MFDIDEVKEYERIVKKPLAELCAMRLKRMVAIKGQIREDGVAIGISPKDAILNQLDREETTILINDIFNKARRKDESGTIVPLHPLSVQLIGEYSPKHRWHYHGIIKVQDIRILDYIRRRITAKIGRCQTEQIRNTKDYINYMFKQYESPEFGLYYPFIENECYININK